MKFELHIECDNAVFQGTVLGEVARILKSEAEKMARFGDEEIWDNTLFDLNGNKVGRATLKEHDD